MIYYEIQNLYEEHISKGELKKQLEEAQIEFYAFILHDKDKASNGGLKKPHYHCIIGIEVNNKKAKSVAEAFATSCLYEKARVNNIRNLCNALCYLVHKKDANKYQYEVSEIVTNDDDIIHENIVEFCPKINDSDMLIEEFYTYLVKNDFECSYVDMFNFFKEHKKLDYFIQHQGKLQSLVMYLKSASGIITYREDSIEEIQQQCIEKEIDRGMKDYE